MVKTGNPCRPDKPGTAYKISKDSPATTKKPKTSHAALAFRYVSFVSTFFKVIDRELGLRLELDRGDEVKWNQNEQVCWKSKTSP